MSVPYIFGIAAGFAVAANQVPWCLTVSKEMWSVVNKRPYLSQPPICLNPKNNKQAGISKKNMLKPS